MYEYNTAFRALLRNGGIHVFPGPRNPIYPLSVFKEHKSLKNLINRLTAS
jgi:hypothetical protein